MLMLLNLLAVAAAYLIGSLSFAVIVSKFYGMADPRSYGSGNPGATNVLRSGKKKAAALTLLGDALKGLVAVLLARALQDPWSGTSSCRAGAASAGSPPRWVQRFAPMPVQRRRPGRATGRGHGNGIF